MGHGGVEASMLDFRSKGQWLRPGPYHRVVSLDKKLYSNLSFPIQVYKMGAGNIPLGTSISSRGSNNTLSYFMLQKLGFLCLACDFTYLSIFHLQAWTEVKSHMSEEGLHGRSLSQFL